MGTENVYSCISIWLTPTKKVWSHHWRPNLSKRRIIFKMLTLRQKLNSSEIWFFPYTVSVACDNPRYLNCRRDKESSASSSCWKSYSVDGNDWYSAGVTSSDIYISFISLNVWRSNYMKYTIRSIIVSKKFKKVLVDFYLKTLSFSWFFIVYHR